MIVTEFKKLDEIKEKYQINHDVEFGRKIGKEKIEIIASVGLTTIVLGYSLNGVIWLDEAVLFEMSSIVNVIANSRFKDATGYFVEIDASGYELVVDFSLEYLTYSGASVQSMISNFCTNTNCKIQYYNK